MTRSECATTRPRRQPVLAAVASRRSSHLVGRLRGPGLGPPAEPGAGADRDARARPRRDRVRPGRVPAPTTQRAGRASSPARPAARSAASCRCSLHDPEHDPMPEVDAFIDACLASRRRRGRARGRHRGSTGYDDRPVLDELGWKTLLSNLDRIADRADEPRRRRAPPPAHRHDGRERAGGRAGARRLDGRPLRRHRPPRRRRRRPGGDHARPRRPGRCTCTSRTSTATWPRR